MRVTQMPTTPGKAIVMPAAPADAGSVEKRYKSNLSKILSEFDKDDYILLGIIAVLIFEGCDDYILLAALGYLFIMGINFQKT